MHNAIGVLAIVVYAASVGFVWLLLYRKRVGDAVSDKRDVLFFITIGIPFAGACFTAAVLYAQRQSKVAGKEGDSQFLYLVVRGEERTSWQFHLAHGEGDSVLPLEEALLFSDVMTRRRRLLDALKLDVIDRASLLEAAVSNEDTETSHYAVTAVMEYKRKMMLALQESEGLVTRHPHHAPFLEKHAHLLETMLSSALIDSRTYTVYRKKLADVIDLWLETSAPAQDAYLMKIKLEQEGGRLKEAEKWCERYVEAYSNEEAPYMESLRIQYLLRNHDQFYLRLEQLKQSGITFSPETLKVVRFWTRQLRLSGE